MSHPLSLTFKDPKTGENTTVTGSWTDEEWNNLQAYCGYVEELRSTRMMTAMLEGGLRVGCSMRYEEGVGAQLETRLPPDDDVGAFLLRLRPFILTKEHASFERMTGLLGKRLDNQYLRSLLRDLRRLYQGEHTRALFQLRSNEVLLNSEAVLMDWLNGFEYHRDQEKRQKIEDLHRMIPLGFTKAIFVALLVDKADAVLRVNKVVELVLGRRKNLSATFQMKRTTQPAVSS